RSSTSLPAHRALVTLRLGPEPARLKPPRIKRKCLAGLRLSLTLRTAVVNDRSKMQLGVRFWTTRVVFHFGRATGVCQDRRERVAPIAPLIATLGRFSVVAGLVPDVERLR